MASYLLEYEQQSNIIRDSPYINTLKGYKMTNEILNTLPKNARRVHELASKIPNKHSLLIEAYIAAFHAAKWLYTQEGKPFKRVEKKNVLAKAGKTVFDMMKKEQSWSRDNIKHIIRAESIALQCMTIVEEVKPVFVKIASVKNIVGEDGVFYDVVTEYLEALFEFEQEPEKTKPKGYVPIFSHCAPKGYREPHNLRAPWREHAKRVTQEPMVIASVPKYYWMAKYKGSEEFLKESRNETQSEKVTRAKKAVEYIKSIEGRVFYMSPEPDARGRAAKNRYFFEDGEELDRNYTWMMNWYGESWRTNMFKMAEGIELSEGGLNQLKVAAARNWVKKTEGVRLGWTDAYKTFKGRKEEVLDFCRKDNSKGIYYPDMVKAIEGGVGSITNFMLEIDLAASGIGSLVMAVKEKGAAHLVGLLGSDMNAYDTHEHVVKELLKVMIHWKSVEKIYREHKDDIRGASTEIAHGKTVKEMVKILNTFVKSIHTGKIKEITEEGFRVAYNKVLPGVLPLIEQMNRITEIGVKKAKVQTMYYETLDGVRCATSAYSKSRQYTIRATTKDGADIAIKMTKDMPIEYCENGILYEDEHGKIKNKMLGACPNIIQSDDGMIMRIVCAAIKKITGRTPMTKHDGYYTHPNFTGETHLAIYHARRAQFTEDTIGSMARQIAKEANYKVELKQGNLSIEDITFEEPRLGTFVMS